MEQCTYAAVITREETGLDDELTGGWKVIEVSFLVCFVLCDVCVCVGGY